MLTRSDIETALDYMDQHNLIRLARASTGNTGWRQMHCPFHNNGQERKPSCGCSLEGEVRNGIEYKPGRFYCFSCGASYSFAKGVTEILAAKESSLEAHPVLAKYVELAGGGHVEAESLIPEETMSAILNSYAVENLKIRTKTAKQYVSEEELAQYRYTVPYMYQRKLTDAVIDKYDIGFDGKFLPPGRSKPVPCVTFPVHDLQGRTLFVCRRSIEGKSFYLPQGIPKSVFGIYELPQGVKEVIICESVFNALTCVVYGHPAVALFGTGTSEEMDELKKIGVQSFVICLDNDEAGNRGAAKIKKALQNNAMVWTMHVPEGKDANDLTYQEFVECYNRRD